MWTNVRNVCLNVTLTLTARTPRGRILAFANQVILETDLLAKRVSALIPIRSDFIHLTRFVAQSRTHLTLQSHLNYFYQWPILRAHTIYNLCYTVEPPCSTTNSLKATSSVSLTPKCCQSNSYNQNLSYDHPWETTWCIMYIVVSVCCMFPAAQSITTIFIRNLEIAGNKLHVSLRKQPTFGDATTGFPSNDVWEVSAEIPYWYLGSASDWLNPISHAALSIRSTTQISIVTRHQYGISALVSERLFVGVTSGSVTKYRLLSQANYIYLPKIICVGNSSKKRPPVGDSRKLPPPVSDH